MVVSSAYWVILTSFWDIIIAFIRLVSRIVSATTFDIVVTHVDLFDKRRAKAKYSKRFLNKVPFHDAESFLSPRRVVDLEGFLLQCN